jgi:hypothetical protein
MDEDQAYLDYLGRDTSAQGLALSGTQPDIDPESSDSQSGVQGRAFAAMPGNYSRNSRAAGPRDSTPGDEYWFNNGCVYTTVTWNGKSVQLPIVAPFDASTFIKSTILNMTVLRLKSAEYMSWNDRCDILTTRFKQHAPIVESNARTAIAALQEPGSAVYTYDNVELVDNNLRVCPGYMNLAGQFNITANIRRNARYLQFNTTISARNIPIDETEFPTLKAHLFPQPVNFTAHISLPRQGHLVHPVIDGDLLAGPFTEAIETMGQIQEVVMMKLSKNGRTPVAEAAEQFLKDYYNRTKFEAITQLLDPLYVGRMVGLTSLAQRLQALNMTIQTNGKMEFLSVQELFTQYQTHLAELDTGNPNAGNDLPCLTTLFYNALSRRLKMKLDELVPLTLPTSYANNWNRLLSFVTAAKKAEGELQTIAAVASNAARRSAPAIRTVPRGPGPKAFQGARTFMGTSEQPDPSEAEDGVIIPAYKNETELRELYATNLVLLSSAEQAMRQASGMRAPISCWGCQGIERYEGKGSAHSYRECPNKSDPEVVENFKVNLQKWKEEKKQNSSDRYRGGGGDRERNWSALGYQSREQHEMMMQIVDPETSKTARRAMIAALLTQKNEQAEPNPRKKFRIFFSYSMTNDEVATEAEGEVFRSFLAPRLSRFQFPISDALPFIDLPIGRECDEDEQHIFLRGLADTGGCCTMAWKPYMLKLKEKFPAFVSEHTVLKERQFEDIKIGGIQGGVWITDVIVFYMPFATNGENHGIMFGLTDDLPINILYGLPFLIQAQITMDMDAQTATSKVLATTFKLNMLPPKRTNLDTIDYKVGSRATYHSQQDDMQE